MQEIIARGEAKEWGNSLGIRIPKKIRDMLDIHDGSEFVISVENDKIVLKKISDKKELSLFDLSKDIKLSDLTDKINKKNMHSNQDIFPSDEAVGKEVW